MAFQNAKDKETVHIHSAGGLEISNLLPSSNPKKDYCFPLLLFRVTTMVDSINGFPERQRQRNRAHPSCWGVRNIQPASVIQPQKGLLLPTPIGRLLLPTVAVSGLQPWWAHWFFSNADKLLYFEWSPPWHFKTATLTSPSLFISANSTSPSAPSPLFCPKLVLSSRDLSPTNYPAPAELQVSTVSCDILSGILSGISSDILSRVLSGDLLPSSNPKNGYFFPLLLFPGYNHGGPNGFL